MYDRTDLRAMCSIEGDWGGTEWGEAILELLEGLEATERAARERGMVDLCDYLETWADQVALNGDSARAQSIAGGLGWALLAYRTLSEGGGDAASEHAADVARVKSLLYAHQMRSTLRDACSCGAGDMDTLQPTGAAIDRHWDHLARVVVVAFRNRGES